MATGSSIVGTWNAFTDWGCDGNPVFAAVFTFKADGSWSYPNGGGRWMQVEGMCFFNFTNASGLIYTANVTLNAVVGVMGYPSGTIGSGCWWATRTGAPHALAEAEVAEEGDAAIGPPQS
jgi:hypothetical protein